MLNLAICDDDIGVCNQITGWIDESKQFENSRIESFYEIETLLAELDAGKEYDLIFLDIEFMNSSGIELAKYVRQVLKNEDINIVFISGKAQYSLQLFEMEPLNFHVKPLVKEKILDDISKVKRRLLEERQEIHAVTKQGVRCTVLLKELMCMEAQMRTTVLYLRGREKLVIKKKFSDMLNEIHVDFGCQCHRSYWVNMKYVHRIKYQDLQLADGTLVPIGRNHADNVKKVWKNYR